MNILGVGKYFVDPNILGPKYFHMISMLIQTDYNTSFTILILILGLGTWGAKMMSNHLIRLNEQIIKNKL